MTPRLRGRFVVRQGAGGKLFLFGELVSAEGLGLDPAGFDLLLVADLTATAHMQRVCPETENQSPEDVLEKGIPPFRGAK